MPYGQKDSEKKEGDGKKGNGTCTGKRKISGPCGKDAKLNAGQIASNAKDPVTHRRRRKSGEMEGELRKLNYEGEEVQA